MGNFPYIAGKKASQATQSHFLSNDSKVGINICAGESSLPSDYIGQTIVCLVYPITSWSLPMLQGFFKIILLQIFWSEIFLYTNG